MEGQVGEAAPEARGESLGKRLRRHALDPSILSNPPVAAAFCLLRALHLIAPVPYWLLITLVFTGGTIAIVCATIFSEGRKAWHLPAYVGVTTCVIGVIAYATGWGPILSIGFVFGAGSSLQHFGSAATKWNLRFTVLCMTLAQLAIALGLAPTLIREPLVHGLAGLSLLGALLTISLLGRATGAREVVETELRQSERRFKALVSNATDVIMVVDERGHLKYVSPAFERTLGLSTQVLKEQSPFSFIHPEDLERMNVEYSELMANPERTLRTHIRIRHANGNWRQFEAAITDRTDDPDVRGIVGNLHDITDLLEAHEWFKSAFEDAPIGMALATMDGAIVRANRAYGSIMGYPHEEMVGKRIEDFTHPEDWGPNELELHRISDGHSDGYEIEKRYIHADGHEVWALVHASCVRDSGGSPRYLIGQIQDVTEARRLRERLAHAAIHDPLTGLPNRELFVDRLHMALRRAGRNGRRVVVAFLDLDRFKLVNDGLGHSAGDELLKAVATRLREALRSEDTVARFGGDEFTILWELDDDQEPLYVVQRILEELKRPFNIEQAPVFVTASGGVAVSGDAATSAASMLRDADSAMYLAKESGRSRVEVFDGTGSAKALESLRVMSELHSALANGEFELHYQPIVELSSDNVVGVEALVRWRHPERGLLYPGHFIPMAEECGLIVPLGEWVLRTACDQAARWQAIAETVGQQPLEINVNLSPRQLIDPGLVHAVSAALCSTGLSPATLCIEITEGTLMRNERASADALNSLRRLGVRISVDDFGTGYSSLSYLKHFPIDSLKVDRTFVDGLGEEPDDSVIACAIIGLAHSLGLTAVAEGVETEIALEELRNLSCDRVQGFLLGYPQPAADLEAMVFSAPALAVHGAQAH